MYMWVDFRDNEKNQLSQILSLCLQWQKSIAEILVTFFSFWRSCWKCYSLFVVFLQSFVPFLKMISVHFFMFFIHLVKLYLLLIVFQGGGGQHAAGGGDGVGDGKSKSCQDFAGQWESTDRGIYSALRTCSFIHQPWLYKQRFMFLIFMFKISKLEVLILRQNWYQARGLNLTRW